MLLLPPYNAVPVLLLISIAVIIIIIIIISLLFIVMHDITIHCAVADSDANYKKHQQATQKTGWLLGKRQGEGNQLITWGPDEEQHKEELSNEQEEELKNLPEPEEPHKELEGLPGVQQADQQQQHEHGGHHWWHADELAAAQGLVAHHCHSGNHSMELPDLHGQLSGTALEREWQINEEKWKWKSLVCNGSVKHSTFSAMVTAELYFCATDAQRKA